MSPLMRYMLRGLAGRRLITFVMITSMIMVGFALATMGAVGIGIWTMLHSTGNPNRVLVLSKGAFADVYSAIAIEHLGTITVTPGVRRFTKVEVDGIYVPSDGSNQSLRIRGVDPDGIGYYGVKVIAGRLPKEGEYEIMVGALGLKRHPHLAIGDKLKFVNHEYTCVGVFSASPYYTSEVWTSRTAMDLDRGYTTLSMVAIETDSPEQARQVAATVSHLRGVDCEALVEPDYYARLSTGLDELFGTLFLVFALVVAGSILAAGSALVMLFRRRMGDIALLRAIGFRSGRIARLLLFEIEIITMSGALGGVSIAFVALNNFVGSVGIGATPIAFTADVTPAIFGAVVATMGFIGAFSLSPLLLRLKRLNITDGLREE